MFMVRKLARLSLAASIIAVLSGCTTLMREAEPHTVLGWVMGVRAGTPTAPAEPAAEPSLLAYASAPESYGEETWQAFSGQSLRDTVAAWSSRAGYELVWDADYDFPVRAGIRLAGGFIQVVTNLFNAYAAADRPLSVDIFKEQKLVRVYARGE